MKTITQKLKKLQASLPQNKKIKLVVVTKTRTSKEIEEAISALEESMKGDDKQDIEDKTKALAEASSSLAQRLYAEQQANASSEPTESESSDDSAVDADFEEVKEEEKEEEKN